MKAILRTLTVSLLLWSLVTVATWAQAPDTAWTRLYGGAAPEIAYAGTQTSDGCFVIAGYTSSFGAFQCDGYFVKINPAGDSVWTRMYGESYYDYPQAIVESHDQGLVMAGKHSFPSSGIRKAWLLKLDAQGDKVWEKNYQAGDDLETEGFCQTADSGFAIVGYTGPYGNYDAFILRTDSAGDSLWIRTYGGGLDDKACAVVELPDSGFMIAGLSESYGAGDYDTYVLRIDKNGDTVWTRTFGGEYIELEPAIIAYSDGDYVIGGSIYYDGAPSQMFHLIKMQLDGDTTWTRELSAELNVSFYNLCELDDHGFLITGASNYGFPLNSQVFLMRTDANGDSLWTAHFGGNEHDQGKFVYQAATGEIYVGAGWGVSGPNGEFYAIKLEGTSVGLADDDVVLPSESTLRQNYPNPFNAATEIRFALERPANVTLEVFNITGQRVVTLHQGFLTPGEHAFRWDGRDSTGKTLASGLYLYRLACGEASTTRKMLLLK